MISVLKSRSPELQRIWRRENGIRSLSGALRFRARPTKCAAIGDFERLQASGEFSAGKNWRRERCWKPTLSARKALILLGSVFSRIRIPLADPGGFSNVVCPSPASGLSPCPESLNSAVRGAGCATPAGDLLFGTFEPLDVNVTAADECTRYAIPQIRAPCIRQNAVQNRFVKTKWPRGIDGPKQAHGYVSLLLTTCSR